MTSRSRVAMRCEGADQNRTGERCGSAAVTKALHNGHFRPFPEPLADFVTPAEAELVTAEVVA